MSKAQKDEALAKIANGWRVMSVGKSKFCIDDVVVHVRFCSTNAQAPDQYKCVYHPCYN